MGTNGARPLLGLAALSSQVVARSSRRVDVWALRERRSDGGEPLVEEVGAVARQRSRREGSGHKSAGLHGASSLFSLPGLGWGSRLRRRMARCLGISCSSASFAQTTIYMSTVFLSVLWYNVSDHDKPLPLRTTFTPAHSVSFAPFNPPFRPSPPPARPDA